MVRTRASVKKHCGEPTRRRVETSLSRGTGFGRPEMSLRLHGDLKAVPQSVVVGQGVVVEARVENKGASEGEARLDVELRAVGGKPPPLQMTFAPAAPATVRPKKREDLRFIWRAELPEGVPALTFRGTIILRDAQTGQDLGRGTLDVYVRTP
jgi:hypothetical protein